MNATIRGWQSGFNPYSPGFSIYLKMMSHVGEGLGCFNPYSPGFSIYLSFILKKVLNDHKASILIHLDFLSIL